MTERQTEALRALAAGDCGVIGGGTRINGNTYRGLDRAGLIDGRGWRSDPFRINEAGRAALAREETG